MKDKTRFAWDLPKGGRGRIHLPWRVPEAGPCPAAHRALSGPLALPPAAVSSRSVLCLNSILDHGVLWARQVVLGALPSTGRAVGFPNSSMGFCAQKAAFLSNCLSINSLPKLWNNGCAVSTPSSTLKQT